MGLTTNLCAEEKKGFELRVLKEDGEEIKGELIAVKEDSLLILDSVSGSDRSISIEVIKRITIKSRTGGAVLAGLAVGSMLGVLIAGQTQSESGGFGGPDLSGASRALSVLLCGIAGGFLGYVAASDENIWLFAKTDTEKEAIMEKLKTKARIQNFQ